MMWQDYVFAVVGTALNLSLVPQVVKGFRERRPLTSVYTGTAMSLGCYVFAYTNCTLDLYLAAASSAFGGTMWTILLGQAIAYRNNIEE